MFSNELLESIDKSVLCWLATASGEGIPNVSPKEMFTAIVCGQGLAWFIAGRKVIRP